MVVPKHNKSTSLHISTTIGANFKIHLTFFSSGESDGIITGDADSEELAHTVVYETFSTASIFGGGLNHDGADGQSVTSE